MSGHCEHCHPDCQGGRSISVDDPSIIGHDSANQEWAATWMVCPACAERESILAELIKLPVLTTSLPGQTSAAWYATHEVDKIVGGDA